MAKLYLLALAAYTADAVAASLSYNGLAQTPQMGWVSHDL